MEDKNSLPEPRLTLGSREEYVYIYSAGASIIMGDMALDIESTFTTGINSPEIILNASNTYGAYYRKGNNPTSEIATKRDLAEITSFMDKLLSKLTHISSEDFSEEIQQLTILKENFKE